MTATAEQKQHFAAALRRAMDKKGWNASTLAGKVWGKTLNKKGYQVSRGRDHIGKYLKATSYPSPENMRKIADALGVSVESLTGDRAQPAPIPENNTTGTQTSARRTLGDVEDLIDRIRDRDLEQMHDLMSLGKLVRELREGRR